MRKRQSRQERREETRPDAAEPAGGHHAEDEHSHRMKELSHRRHMNQSGGADACGTERIAPGGGRGAAPDHGAMDSLTAARSSLGLTAFGNPFGPRSRRAASAELASPRRKRAERRRIGAAYTARSAAMRSSADCGSGTSAMMSSGTPSVAVATTYPASPSHRSRSSRICASSSMMSTPPFAVASLPLTMGPLSNDPASPGMCTLRDAMCQLP